MTSQDDPKSRVRFENLGRKLDQGIGQASRSIEQESEKVIAYLNDEVVPAIRNNSSKALRVAAEKLSRLAEYMEKHGSK
ncbi:MAG: hypothetical protein LAP21_27470 [Acidobacteriia bacterium]|nr:hypothetical protein [Terriglobia bacterium]